MRFKIDENLPVDLAELLRSAGHDAATIFEQKMTGEDDGRIIDVCQAEMRALVTLDLDFSDVRTYPPQAYYGVIVLRLRQHDKIHLIESVKRILPLLEQEQIERRLWIVEENRIRVRGEND